MAMRPISTDGFANVLPATSHGPAPQLQWIKVAHLVVDDSYQRPVDSGTSRASIKAIATAFDWRHFAPVVVSPIAGGHYAIVDGQHRTTGAALCGIETVPCLVILADAQEQAAAFHSINGQVTKVGRGQIFKARLRAGDPEAIRIDRVAAAAGVRLLYSHQDYGRLKPNETTALNVITALVKASGDAVVTAGLRAILFSAGDCTGYLKAGIIKAVVHVLVDNPAWVKHPNLDLALSHLDLAEEQEKARIQALRHRSQSAADNLRIRVAAHLEEHLAAKAGRAA